MARRISPEVIAGQLLPANVMFFVDACVRLGEPAKGTNAVVEGLKLADTLEQQWIVPELHRLHAALLMLAGQKNHNEFGE